MADLTITSPEIHQKRESCWPEILKRVPASQLGICLCVSKKWNSLITSKTFISSHINFFSQQSSNLFLLRSFSMENPLKPCKELYHICSDQETSKTLETLIKKTYLCPFKTSMGFQFRVVGCVNGVIFLTDDAVCNSHTCILWNPIVNCFIQLPRPRVTFDAVGPYVHATGFGYDSVSDDFKVVRIVYTERSDGLHDTPPRAELYSVKEGKWRWVSADNVKYCTVDKEWSQCFLNGNIHWVAYERFGVESRCSHKSNLLLLFNVEKEKFMMMRLPVELRDVCPLDLMVSECHGLLCVSHCVRAEMLAGVYEELLRYNLWVKKEYNKGSSWCKVANADCRGSSLKKAVYWRMNGELLAWSKSMELVSYNLETNAVAVLAPGYIVLYDACSFVGSLAFLNKDCKERRCFSLDEGEDGNNDDGEIITSEKVLFARMGAHFAREYMMHKLGRQF